ncbi:hypothetical protein Pla123a_01670 [Posidoniimonas polymericola]|uniref:DUF4142 domain-containing protein n=1 Tax=Posidoniimonas polymericola TaxID=2528002 RepID=A0A5C5ZDX1_9BACT|nr:DUF4142 domain-containing protein [Posidoniimonas polymericola]TWT85360.1 hypothetical protein Pla123a_01670 [Posidoniimonas polymericola]
MSNKLAMAMAVTLGLPIAAVAQQSITEPTAQGVDSPLAAPLQEQPLQDQAMREDLRQQQDGTAPLRRQANFRGDQDSQSQSSQSSSQANQELIHYLAAKLMLANQCEVEAATMAAERAQHDDVKNLANKIKQSHEQLNQQLKQAMPGLKSIEGMAFASATGDANRRSATNNAAGGARLGEPVDRFNSRTDRNDPAGVDQYGADMNTRNQVADRGASTDAPQRSGQDGQQGDFLDGGAQTLIDITRRAAENNHQMVKRELSEKQGLEFDRCFVNQQIGAHMWMHSELKAIQDLGPSSFTSIVQESEQQVKSHLDAAKKLAKKLESDSQRSDRNPVQDAARDAYQN